MAAWWAAVACAAALACAAAAECDPAAQRAALVAFWTATGGAHWSDDWAWPVLEVVEVGHCTWRGVACVDDCVVELDLVDGFNWAGLQGVLPEVWGDLATLRRLDLDGDLFATDRISGPLPASFAELRALREIEVGAQALTGSVAVLEAMPALTEVDLRLNNLDGPLPRMAQPLLRILRLHGNRLTGPIAPEYGALPLDEIRLNTNALTSTVPHELSALPQSTLIDLRNNEHLGGVLPHTLLGRGSNLLLTGTQVATGCAAGSQYDPDTFNCTACEPGFSAPASSYTGTCAACGPGSAAPAAGSACTPCAAGTFANESANTECAPCPDGQRSLPGSSACGECPAGGEPTAVAGGCALCAAGTASPGSSHACEVCPAGTASASGARECTGCGPGLFAASAESETCQECAAGSFANGTANIECAPCPVGAASAAGAGECSGCGPGLFAPSPESNACQQCRPGTFSSGAANAGCAPCPAGLAAPFFASARCEPCGAGRISINGGIACTGCAAGSSTGGAVAASSCTPCAAGTVAPEHSSPACAACPAGSTSNAARTACDPCPAGSSTGGAVGASSCLMCPAGSIAAAAGAPVCDECEPGTFAAEPGRDGCQPCPAGSTTEGAAGATACVRCPAGSVAEAGVAACNLCAPGSFAASDGLAACTLCPAGTHQPEAGAASSCPACRYPGRCREGNECASGYAGAGCLFCAVGHFRLSNVCLTCPVVPWPLLVLAVLGAGLLYAASRRRLGPRQTTILKIVLFYVQMVVVALALRVQWPATQTGFVEAMSFASAEIGLPLAECYVSVGWYAGYAGSLAGPLLVVAVFWAATLVVEWRRRRMWAETEDAEHDFALMGRASNLRRLWLAACAMMHLPLVRVLLGAFDCEGDGDGNLVVAGSDDGTRCDTVTHVVVQAVSGVVLFVVGLVLPVASMRYVLWLRRTSCLDKGSVQAAWGALYEAYRPEYCYLEGVVALRKVFVTLALVVPGIATEWRSVLLLVQSVGWCLFVLVRRPYVRIRGRAVFGLIQRPDVVNELEVVFSVVITLHQSVAGLAAGTNGGVVWVEAGVVLLVITVGVLVAAVWQAARIGRGFEVAPTGFSQAQAERDQRALQRAFVLAITRGDVDEAARIRTEGVRHARQTREFAEWRTSEAKVSPGEVPFLEMVIAEETTTPTELEAAIEAAVTPSELSGLRSKAMAAGHFGLMQRARSRLDAIGAGASPASTSSKARPPAEASPRRLPSLGHSAMGPALRR